MYPAITLPNNRNAAGTSFWDQVSELPGTIESRLPTFDKSLDAYFDRHFAAIIEEWDLVTENDLRQLEARLSRVGDEISALYAEKAAREARVRRLDELITSLEGSR